MKRMITKINVLFCFLMFSASTLFAQLNGNYTINPSGSGGRNYTTFGAAVTALTTSGVNGAVVFDVSASTFNQQVSIGSISGVSSTNTVTFKGAGASSTKLTFAATSSASRHTLTFANNAQFITFRDMTIEGTGSTYAWAVHFYGNTNITDNRLVNCNVTVPYSTSSNMIPIVMSNSTSSYTSGGTTQRILIDSCIISGGYFGTTSYGATGVTTRMQDLTISNCSYQNYYYYGMYMNYQNNVQIINNNFKSATGTVSTYGIYVINSYGYNNGGTTGYSCRINNNTIDATGTYGIYVSSFTGLSTSYNEIINNEILGNFRSTGAQYGIFTSSASYTKIYHNTSFVSNSTTSTAGAWYNSSGSYLDVRNNAFIGMGNARAVYVNSAPTNSTINNNIYWLWGGTSGNLIYWAGTNYNNSNYTSVGGANSFNSNQGWTSQTNFNIKDGCLNGANLGITVDHNGNSRNNPPDIGAYEAATATYDVGVSAIVSPATPANSTSVVKLLVVNGGSASVTNLDASFKVGTSSPNNESFTFSTALASCASDTITFTNTASISGCEQFMAYSGMINSTQADQVNANDTLRTVVGTGMSGTYTVGGSGADYSSISAAIADLECRGVSAAVTFLLNSQTFVEQISIGNIAGTSSSNTITFKGAGINSTTIAFSAATSDPRHTVRIADGAKFIVFRDMTIGGYSSSYAYTVHVSGTTMSDIRFSNCRIQATAASTSSSVIPFVMNNSPTSYTTGGTASRVTIDSCTISGGYFALTAYGLSTNTTTRHQDFTISNSLITDFYYYGLYFLNNNNIQITGNTIRPSTSSTTSSYSMYGSANYADTSGGRTGYKCRILNNILENNGAYGIYLSSFNGLASDNNEVINNVVEGDFRSTSTQYGLYTTSCSYVKIQHNSFAIKNSTTSTAAAWYSSSGSFLNVQNNNFIGNGLSRALYINSAPSSSTVDYNNYYLWGGTSGTLIYWAGSNYDQSNYKTVGGANSYNSNQGWPAQNNLTISDGCINGNNLGVSTDINGVSRSSTPDIGAYEITSAGYDASISAIISPVSPASSTSVVKLLVKNNGSNSISNLDASYQVGTSSPVNESFTFSSALSSCASDSVTFTNTASISGCVNFKAYSGTINTSNADQNNSNDTLWSQVGTAMSGTYTVGGSSANYSTINAALKDLQCGGVNGPVTLLLNSQTFTEQVVIGNIPGISSTNTLTFRGAGPTSTIVNFNSTTSGEGHTIRLIDGANNIFFRDMAITSNSTSYAWPVHIMGSTVADIKFSNCNITTPLSSSTNIIPVVMNNNTTSYSSAGTATRIHFDSCNISGGYFAFAAWGGSATNTRHQDLQITNSNISNFYYYGTYLYYHNNIQIVNNKFSPSSSYTDNYGIYAIYCYGFNNGGSTGYVCRMNRNTFENNGYSALYLDTYMGTSTSNNEVINNVVKGEFRASYPYPINTYYSSYVQFYHNTAALSKTHSVDATWYAYGCDYFDIKNNVLITNSTTPAILFESCSNYTIDYNDFWIWDNKSGYLVSFDYVYYDASNYKSVVGTNNMNVDLGWKSPTDLLQADGCTKGTNVGVSEDIRGNSRNTPPNLGAYELTAYGNDIGVSSIISPSSPASSSSVVKLLVTNYGTNNVSSLNASYKVGAASAVNQSFTLSSALSNCHSDTVTFTTNATISGCSDFFAYTGLINGSATDQNNGNDSMSKKVGVPMSGTYTVGGSSADFANLTEAIEGLNCGGVSGPVVLKLNAQTFTEQISLKAIAGQSNTNTITFQGAGINATRISFFATASDKSYTVRLEGDANNFIFRDLMILGTNTSYAWPVHILGNNVADCKFINCNIFAPTTTSTLVIPVLMNGSSTSYSTTGTATRILFDSCIINGGYAGVWMYGNTASNAVKHQDISILNSTISGFYLYGIYSYYVVNPQIIGNKLTADVSASTNSYGIYCISNSAYNNGGSTGYVCRINRNLIENNGYYGIYLSSHTGLSTAQNELNNNVILGDQRYSSALYAMYLSSCTYSNIYHNTIAAGRSLSNTYGALYISSGSFLNIRNNTLIGNGTTPALRIASTPSSSVINDNNYFNWDGSPTLINNLGTIYDASNYTTVGGANSKNVHQGWPSLTNLNINDGCIRGANLGVMEDINNVTRDSIPNIGAYEIPTNAYDAGVISIVSPVSPATSGTNTVEVVVKNFGTAPVDSFDVKYQYAGGSAVSELFTTASPLSNCQTDTFTFSTSVSLTGCNNLSAWSGTLDGKADMNNQNDTMSVTVGVGMSGTFTVGGTSPDFNTIQDALDALNCSGLNGPVVLSVRPGTYNGQVNFGNIATSSTNTLTVMGATGKPEDVVFTDSTTLTNSRHVVRFMNSKFITLRDVSVINRSKIYGWGVHIFGGSEDIRIANCIISVDEINSTSSNYIPVVVNGSDNGYTTGGYFKNIAIDSNRIYYGYIGVSMYGVSSPAYPEGLKIRNNLISGQYLYGTYTVLLTDLTIEGNDIFGRFPNTTTSGYGIYLSSVQSVTGKPTYRILSNRINNIGYYGIYLTSSSGNATDSARIINNMIGGGFRNSTTYGIYSTSCNYIACYNNSIFMKGGTSTTYGLYTSSSSYWSIKNNHFAIDASATNAGYAMYISTNTGHEIDFNNYYNPSGTNLMYRAAAYNTSTYRVSYAGGDNSRNYAPSFMGDLDLRVVDGCNMPRLGTPLSMVSSDREGNPRSSTTPEIGAHEPGGWANDVVIVRLNNPTVPTLGGVQTVSILVKNFGTTAISSLDAHFQWNGGSIVNQTFNFSTPLSNCDSAVLTFTTSVNINQCGQFAVWTGMINGTGVDQFPSNNRLEYSLGKGLSGSYSVAGASPDFATLNDAFAAIQCAGIAGPTVLNIAPGIYQGQVNIPKFLTSSVNTLTIRSATGNPEDVVFTDSTTVSNNRHIVQLNGSEWITLRDVTIQNRSQTLGWGLHIFNQAANCRIANCIIGVDSTFSNSTNYIPVVINGSNTSYSTGGFNQNILLDSNRINYGYFGISVYGISSSYPEGIRIRSNQINRPYVYGIYCATLTDMVIDGNTINNDVRTTSGYSIYLSSVSSFNNKPAPVIINNRIINPGFYGIYLTSSDGVFNMRGLIANNSIGGGFRTTAYGIYLTSSDYWDVWHNTVNTTGGGGTCYGFYGSSSTNLNIRNNNFAVMDPGASTSSYALYTNSNSGNLIDFNNYYNPRGTNLLYNVSAYTTSNYQSSVAGGSNSRHAMPIFEGDLDLRIKDKCFTKGDTISLISTDIFGNARVPQSPFVGMHEIQLYTNDAMASTILEPVNPVVNSTNYDVKVVVKNVGTGVITTLDVGYVLNGSVKKQTITGLNLNPCDTAHIVFTGTNQASFNIGVNRMRAFTANVNTFTDADHSNDTSEIQFFCSNLSGSYTINPTGTGSTNFKNFSDVAQALMSCGISGAVTFTVAPGTYNEGFELAGIVNGASATNTITIDGVNPSNRILRFDGISSAQNAVIQLAGTKYLTIKNLGIHNFGSTHAVGIRLNPIGMQSNDSIQITGCDIQLPVQTSAISTQYGLIATAGVSTLTAGNSIDNLLFSGNTVTGGYYGFGSYGDITGRATGISILNNRFNSQYQYGIYTTYYHDSLTIHGNSFDNLGNGITTLPYAIYSYQNVCVKITSNKTCNQNGGYGIYSYYTTGLSDNPSVIANNMLNVGNFNTTNSSYGILNYYSTYTDIAHNSVVINTQSPSGGAGLYYYSSGAPTYMGNNIVNNSFVNNGPGYAAYISGSANTTFQSSINRMDNNNYRSNGSYAFRFISTIFNDIPTWQSTLYAGPLVDSASMMIDPEYLASCNLHTYSFNLNDKGTPIASVTTDIDGETRSSTTPDIGADEFLPPADNAKVVAIISPAAPASAGSHTVSVVIENKGSDPLTSLNVHYKANAGGAIRSQSWSGNLLTGDRDTIHFTGAQSYSLANGVTDTLFAFSDSPNGVTDGYTPDDSTSSRICAAYAGNYALGTGGDFTSFAQAAEALNVCGVSAPVYINVASGVYNEQAELKLIPGVNSINQVTFQSATGKAEDVVVRFASTGTANNYILKFNQADYIRIRKMTFEAVGTSSWGTIIQLTGSGNLGSDYNVFEGNVFRGLKTATTSTLIALVSSSSDNNEFNTFSGNSFLYGSMGIYFPGYAVNPLYSDGWLIESNTFDSIYYMDMYLYYTEKFKIRNNTLMTNTSYTGHYGIYLYYPSNGIEISGNKILFDQTANYPVFMAYHNNNYGTDSAWIFNNFISWDFASAGSYGFYSLNNRNMMFLHNSIYTNGSSTSGLYYSASTVDSATFIDNIFQSRNYAFYVASNPPTGSDYNNYFTSGTNMVYYLGNRSSLLSLEGAYYFGSDANSKVVNPQFLSATELRPTNAALINSGTYVGIATDIDGDLRSTSTPSMGAEEIKGNLEVAEIIGLNDTACNRNFETVQVKLRNKSFVTLSNFGLELKLNSSAPVSETFTGSIIAGDSAVYTFNNQVDLSTIGANTIKVTGVYANDEDLSNNESQITIVNADNPKPSMTYRDTCFQKPVSMTYTGSLSIGTVTQINWNFNNGNTATGNSVYQAYSGVGPYTVTITATSSAGCVGTANGIARVLSDLNPGTIGSSQTICYNTSPLALSSAANPTGSDGTYTYQWESSADGINFSDISGATSYAYQPPALTDTMWYRRRVNTALGCGPKTNNTVKINTYTPIAAGSISTDQTICYNTAPAALTQVTAPSGGDGSFTHIWEYSLDNTNWQTVIGATNANYTPGKLTTTTYYRRQDIAGSNCGTKTTNSIKINVYDELKAGNFVSSYDICPNGDPGTFSQTSAPSGGNGAYTFQWQSGNGSSWTDISGATNATYAPGSVASTTYYRRNVTSGAGCGTVEGTGIIVNVRALPKASFSTSYHCFGDKVPLVNSSTPGFGIITNYAWNFEAGGNSTLENPTYVYSTDGTKIVKLVVTNSLGCKDSTTRTTFVSRVPQASYVYFYDCATDSLRFKSTTSINCGTILAYNWDFGDGTTSNLENPVKKFAAGTFNVKFKIDFSGGISDSVTQVITVYPKGNLDFNAPEVCYNDVSKFTNTSSSAGNYLWDFGDNFTSNAVSPDHLYATSGTYTVKLTGISLNGCNLSVTKTHTVKVRPDADIVTDDRCLGDTTHYSNGSLYSHTYLWHFGDGRTSTLKEPTNVYAASGNYTVKLVATNNNGCVDSTTSTAVVHALPVANFTISNSCVSKDIVFNNTSTGAVSFSWNLGDGSTSAMKSPVYQYANAGTYNINLMATSGFGCKNSITKSVDIYPKPKADFTTANVCAGTSATFTNKSTISSGTVSYMWYFGDGTTSNQVSPSKTYASAGVYNVKLIATSGNGCSDSITSAITIHTGAVASFTSGNACLGQGVTFNNTSNNATSYTWTFGDGNGSNVMSPTHTYNTVGNYTVTLIANNSNGCSSMATRTVQVNPVPTAGFTATTVCQGTATTFTNGSSISSGTISYSWDFGNGSSSTLTNPTLTYASAGTYNVILTVTSNNACATTAIRTVTVHSNPVSDFSASNVCAGTGLQFVNNSSAGSYVWNFGNGNTSTAANPNYTYPTAGTYNITLTVTNSNNCSSVSSKTITVYALPVTNFTATTVCAGNATVFTNTSSGAVSYNWQFGEGGASVSANPSYIYKNAGTYSATLISTNANGCNSQVSKSVTVNAVPVASFTSSDVCLGTAANFTNTSTGTGNSYNWLFGDGGSATSTNASRTYAAAGAYNVTLTATNGVGCVNIATKTINVFTNPTAAFTHTDQCIGSNMVFTNQSTGAVLYNWQFGDGTSSPLTNPVKGYAAVGAYNVTLTATNSNKCSNSITKVVNINPNPVASFTGTPICTSNTAQMNNTSTISSGTMTYSWNFGDGGTSTLPAPSHTFPAEGSYVVTLTASSGAGCKSTVQNTVSVAPVPVADFSANEVCLGGTTVFTNLSTGDANAVWTFGDATGSNLLSPIHTYSTAGTYNVGLTVTSKYGCVSNISKNVVVNPNPVAAFTASNACQGTPVSITNNSSGATSYEWYYGYIGPDKVTTPNVMLDNPGPTVIRLVAITNKGCRNETSRNVEVYTSPKADFTVMKACQGDQTLFVNKSLNAGSYNWQFGDGNNSGNTNPSHQYANAGTYKVVLTANNAQCSNQYTMDVVVNPLPGADFTFTTSGKEVSFTSSNKTNVKSYDWNFGDGSFGSDADPKHLYNNAIVQVFNVCLNVTDNAGCQNEVCKNVSVNLLGKEEVEIVHSSVVVYPNPNRGQFNVFVSGSQDRAVVEVYNLVGVKVADASNSGNDLYYVSASELSEGAYLVKVTFEGKTSVHRIMIAK